MEALGIDVGSLFLGAVLVDEEGVARGAEYIPHHGRPAEALKKAAAALGMLDGCYIGLTGSGAPLLADQLEVGPIDQAQALLHSVREKCPEARCVIEVGGSNLTLFRLDEFGAVRFFNQNSLCAAGTGSFLDEQAARLGINYDDLKGFPEIPDPPTIATRCAVFAKSDLIHRQQQGCTQAEMWAGLCKGMTTTIVQTLMQGRPLKENAVLVGGVSRNPLILKNLADACNGMVASFPGAHLAAAEGAARIALARQDARHVKWEDLEDRFTAATKSKARKTLALQKTIYPDFSVHKFYADAAGNEVRVSRPLSPGPKNVYLGVDIGSTSTKMVILDETGEVIADIYRKTRGEPIEAARKLFEAAQNVMEDTGAAFEVMGCATTGSGRKLVGAVIGADIVINEITAHVRGALATSPDIETVFEIGGQDSKFMSLRDGRVQDSNMNYVCAAGTGSFIEEQANKLGFAVSEVGDRVLGITPPHTSDRCTVFMEQDIFRLIREGKSREETLAATMYSICQNYLNKVVGKRKISSDKIAFMGATARNKGLVAAFENLLGVEMVVSPYCHVMGALGVALLAKEKRVDGRKSKFLGFDLSHRKITLKDETCRLCNNNCAITHAEIEGAQTRPSWGYLCGREPDEGKKRKTDNFDLFKMREKMLNTMGRLENLAKDAPQIGIPSSLTSYTYRPLWERFFNRLGYRVRFSPATDPAVSKEGVSLVAGDFCYPVKVGTGHVASLLRDKSVPFVFVPVMIAQKGTEKLPNKMFCPWVESHPPVLRSSLRAAGLDTSRLLDPPVDFRAPEKTTVRKLCACLGEKLGRSKSEIRAAWGDALRAQEQFNEACQYEGTKILESIRQSGEKAIVIVGRPYNAFDPGVNLSLPLKFAQYGYRVIPVDFIPFSDDAVPEEYRDVFWAYGQRILGALEAVRANEQLFAVYLSNFSCGPDSFLLSYAERIMSDKPMLILTLDEHGADTGYLTRIEAFLDVIKERRGAGKRNPVYIPDADSAEFRRRKIWIPPMHPFGTPLFASAFEAFGWSAEALPPEDEEAFELGRSMTRGEECLPASATLGTLLKTLRDTGADPKKTAFFMPTAPGPCRFGQYALLHRMALNSLGYKDVPILSPSSTNTYMGLEDALRRRLWLAMLLSDIFFKAGCRIRPYEMRNGDTDRALEQALRILSPAFADKKADLDRAFIAAMEHLDAIPRRDESKPLVGIVGEIYVRCNAFSNENVVRAVESYGGEAWLAPMAEWILYTTFSQKRNAKEKAEGIGATIETYIKNRFLHRDERHYYALAGDILADRHEPPIEDVLADGMKYMPLEFEGESVLTIGRAIQFAKQGAAMVVNCGPFGCMHGSITDAIFREIEDNTGIPILNMAYDGEGGQNRRIEVFFKSRQ